MALLQATRIFMIGGTGAQGIPIVHALVKDNKYTVKILTRDPESQRARNLDALPGVELYKGSFTNQDDVQNGLKGCDGAFVNIDGFNCGEKNELFWGIRIYEMAIAAKIKFYVWGNLDYALKNGGWDAKFRCSHMDGKGRVAEWILQHATPYMGVAVFTTGPYLDMALSPLTLMTPRVIDGVVTWSVPLGNGEIPHVALSDCGVYTRWLFDNPSRSNGLDLQVAIDHMSYHEIANAFTKVTGRPAQYVDVDFDSYFASFSLRENFWSTLKIPNMSLLSKVMFGLSFSTQKPTSYSSDAHDGSVMSFEKSFTGFWNVWRETRGNSGVVRRDYQLLDEIHPKRIKSAEEWFRREAEKGDLWERVNGSMVPVLKWSEDGRRGGK